MMVLMGQQELATSIWEQIAQTKAVTTQLMDVNYMESHPKKVFIFLMVERR